MPSPFPGMDPYLENPAIWPSLHQRLITYSADVLQPVLKPRYHANIGERLYVVPVERSIYPDVSVIQRGGLPVPAGAASVLVADTPTVLYLTPEEIREPFIEILDLTHGGQVVTVIEVLSPANKTPGEGLTLYRQKQKEIIYSSTHLVEIDLLRAGVPTALVPLDLLEPLQPWHYLVNIRRAPRRGKAEVYAVSLRQRLPRIIIPLTAPDPDAVLDLQAVFERAYENGAYADRIDYSQPPTPPLSPEDATWAATLLHR